MNSSCATGRSRSAIASRGLGGGPQVARRRRPAGVLGVHYMIAVIYHIIDMTVYDAIV